MSTAFGPRTLVLFVGDLAFLIAALWVSLLLRSVELPSAALFWTHLAPFSLLFVAWVVVFFIAGLYERRTIALAPRALSTTLLTAQTLNMGVAAAFFFLVPVFGIAPKTLLFVYLLVSFYLVMLWRTVFYPALMRQGVAQVSVVGNGPELVEVERALAKAQHPPVVLVPHGQGTPVPLAQLYEEMFGRVALSAVEHGWARNSGVHTWYDPLKRLMDIVLALPLFVVSLVLYPFIAAAIVAEDRGPVFVGLPRVGQNGRVITIYKFRSMTGNDAGDYGAHGKSTLAVTRVGEVLRKLRLDELPQLLGVVRGDLSLIGPRPETPALVKTYEAEIPHYGLRHTVKPGLSGWAQLYHDNHPHHGTAVEATREKLSYDLYYLMHRSVVLDLVIALKTIKKLVTRSGI